MTFRLQLREGFGVVRNPKRLVLVVLLVAGVIGGVCWIWPEREPQYQGRTVSYWAYRLSSGNERERVEAREVIRTMGKSAVPFLAKVVEADDSRLKEVVRKKFGGRFPVLIRVYSCLFVVKVKIRNSSFEIPPGKVNTPYRHA